MVTRRTAKTKGAQFEYSCKDSLEQVYPNMVFLTKELGFQAQYDIKIKFYSEGDSYIAIECKRQAKLNWKMLVKFYEKLKSKTPDAFEHYVLFQENRQPCMVFYHDGDRFTVVKFEDFFKVPFIIHNSKDKKGKI